MLYWAVLSVIPAALSPCYADPATGLFKGPLDTLGLVYRNSYSSSTYAFTFTLLGISYVGRAFGII